MMMDVGMWGENRATRVLKLRIMYWRGVGNISSKGIGKGARYGDKVGRLIGSRIEVN